MAILESNIFSDLAALRMLRLSHTRITLMPFDALLRLPTLERLDISSINVRLSQYVAVKQLATMENLRHLYIVQPEICCFVSDVICVSDIKIKFDQKNCSRILASDILQYIAILYAFLVLSLNVVSSLWHVRKDKVNVGILTCSLSVADGLMAVYLISIITINFLYSGDTTYIALSWKQSNVCRVVGTSLTISILTSHMFTMLVAVDRFICVVWRPFKRQGFNKVQSVCFCCGAWCAGLVLPMLARVLSDQPASNSPCILLAKSSSLGFSALFTVLTILVSIVVIASYVPLVLKVKESGKITVGQTNKKSLAVVTRVCIVILSSTGLTLTVLCQCFLFAELHISESVGASFGLILLPLFACINPMVNALSTNDFIKQFNYIVLLADGGKKVTSFVADKVYRFVKK